MCFKFLPCWNAAPELGESSQVFCLHWILLFHYINSSKGSLRNFIWEHAENMGDMATFHLCLLFCFFRNIPTPTTCSWGGRRSCLELRESTMLSCSPREQSITRLVRIFGRSCGSICWPPVDMAAPGSLLFFCLSLNEPRPLWYCRSGEDQGLHRLLPLRCSPSWWWRYWWVTSCFSCLVALTWRIFIDVFQQWSNFKQTNLNDNGW